MPKRRRRSFTPQFKAQVVLEVLAGLKSQAEVARQHKLKPELIARWKEVALEGLETLFRGGEQRDQDQEAVFRRSQCSEQEADTLEARQRTQRTAQEHGIRGTVRLEELEQVGWPERGPRPREEAVHGCHGEEEDGNLTQQGLSSGRAEHRSSG